MKLRHRLQSLVAWRTRLPARRVLAMTGLYAAAAVVVTWPTAGGLTTHLPGNSADTLLHYWNGWRIQTALSQGQSLFFTDLLFYPRGVSLVTHNTAWMNVLPWLGLAPLVGGIAAYNLILLGSLVICGWSSYGLAYRLTRNRYAAFLAGLIYLAWPFRLSQLDHPNLLATYWVPVFMLGLVNILERRRWRDVALTGLALALVGYTRWQILIPVAVMAVTYVLSRPAAWWPRRHGLRVVGRLTAAALVGALLLVPPLALLVREQLEHPAAASLINDEDEIIMQTDLLAYVTPPGWNQLFSSWSQDLYDHYYPERPPGRRYPAYLGLVALGLAGAGLVWRRKEGLPWLFVTLVLTGLAAGPVLRLHGALYDGAPTLYHLLMDLEFIRLIRVPDRFDMFLALPISMLSAYGLAAWLARRPHGWTRPPYAAALVTGALSLLVLAEYQIIPVNRHDVSYDTTDYAQIAAEPGAFAVLNVPFLRGTEHVKAYMFDQTAHHRPILQGNASRLPADVYAAIDANPWLALLREQAQFSVPPPVGDAGRQLARLSADGVRYIILHKQRLDPGRLAHWQRYLLVQPRYEDERIAVYSTTPELGRDVQPMATPAPGLHLTQVFLPTGCYHPGQVVNIGAAWFNSAPLDARYEAAIGLRHQASGRAIVGRFPLTDLGPTETWPPASIGQGAYSLSLDGEMPAGRYAIELQLMPLSPDRPAGPPVEVATIDVQPEPCALPPPVPPAAVVNATFGDLFILRHVTVSQGGDQLVVTLDWLALQPPARDYTVFVHLIDKEPERKVAQIDAMPVAWQYPTSWWWSGQQVTDPVRLDTAGVAPGSYTLVVGMYAADTGERLGIVDGQGAVVWDRLLRLPQPVIVDGT